MPMQTQANTDVYLRDHHPGDRVRKVGAYNQLPYSCRTKSITGEGLKKY